MTRSGTENAISRKESRGIEKTSSKTSENLKKCAEIMKKLKGVLGKSNDREKKMIEPGRAIFVQGDLEEALVLTLTPKIIALRQNPQKPTPGG